MRKLLAFSMAALIAVPPSVSAAPINARFDRETRNIFIDGELGSSCANSRIIGIVLEEGSALPSLADSDYASAVTGVVDGAVGFFQADSDENGDYTFAALPGSDLGKTVDIYVAADSQNSVHTEKLFVPSKSAEDSFVDAVRSAASAAEIKTLLDSESDNPTYGADMRYYKKISSARGNVASAIYARRASYNGNDAADKLDDDIFIFSFLADVSENHLSDTVTGIMDIENSSISTSDRINVSRILNLDVIGSNSVFTYLKSANADEKKTVATATAAKVFTTPDEFEDALYISLINTRFANASGWRDAYKTVSAHTDVLDGINLSKLGGSENNQQLWTDIVSQSYGSTAELIKKFNDWQSSGGTGGGSSGASGSSGSKGGSGSGSISSVIPGNIVEPTQTFADLGGYEWAKDAVELLSQKGIVNGVANGVYDPSAFVTREQFVKMLVRALGIPAASGVDIFGDVRQSDWYYSDVCTAYAAGIIKGIGDGIFGAGEYITREDMAVSAYRALAVKIGETDNHECNFIDAGDISDYAVQAVANLTGMGILSGNPDGGFAPKNLMTRAEAAVLINNMLFAIN